MAEKMTSGISVYIGLPFVDTLKFPEISAFTVKAKTVLVFKIMDSINLVYQKFLFQLNTFIPHCSFPLKLS